MADEKGCSFVRLPNLKCLCDSKTSYSSAKTTDCRWKVANGSDEILWMFNEWGVTHHVGIQFDSPLTGNWKLYCCCCSCSTSIEEDHSRSHQNSYLCLSGVSPGRQRWRRRRKRRHLEKRRRKTLVQKSGCKNLLKSNSISHLWVSCPGSRPEGGRTFQPVIALITSHCCPERS